MLPNSTEMVSSSIAFSATGKDEFLYTLMMEFVIFGLTACLIARKGMRQEDAKQIIYVSQCTCQGFFSLVVKQFISEIMESLLIAWLEQYFFYLIRCILEMHFFPSKITLLHSYFVILPSLLSHECWWRILHGHTVCHGPSSKMVLATGTMDLRLSADARKGFDPIALLVPWSIWKERNNGLPEDEAAMSSLGRDPRHSG